jgi:tRNA(Ile)-lysidine synthase
MAPSTAAAADPFLDALRAALSEDGAWAAPLVIGVSGGPDSMALLLGMSQLATARQGPTRLIVAHAEHDLRVEAATDRMFVAAAAAELQLPFVTRRLAVRSADGVRGEGVEARARRLRYGFFTEAAQEAGARRVALAHTADDQAETILHRALRGTGLAGLAGMPAARELADGIAVVRPLLGLSRAAVRTWLAARGATWCDDASNLDTSLARNFLRHEIIARCQTGPYPAATAALASAADHLLEIHSLHGPAGALVLQAAPFAGLDPQLVAEVFRTAWCRQGWPQRDMTERHYRGLARLLAAVAGDQPAAAVECPGRIRAAAGPARTLVVGPAQDFISTRR